MDCGIYLGMFLILFFQAEHGCCLRGPQVPSSFRPNGNRYVGLSKQDRPRFGDGHPQDEFRQVAISPHTAQSSNFNTQTAVNSGYGEGLSSSSYMQSAVQPAQRGVTYMQSSKVSNPNQQITNPKPVNAQESRVSGLWSSVVSGSSLTRNSKMQSPECTSSCPSPSREGYLSSRQSEAQKPLSAADQTPASNGQGAMSSKLFSRGASAPHRNPVQSHTSGSTPARRVSSKGSVSSSRGSSRGGSNPKPQSQMLSYKPSSTSTGLHSQDQGTRNLPATGSSTVGTAGKHVLPSTTHDIPQSFGGFPIRRLKEPAGPKGVSVGKPQQRPVYPPQQNPVYPPQQNPVYPPQQNPVYPPQQNPVYLPQQNPVYPPQQNPVYPPQQNPVYPPQQNPVYLPQQNPVYPPQQNPVYPPQQNPVYPPQQKPVYPPQQKPVYPPQQKPVYPGQQRPVYPLQQKPVYPPQQKPVYPGQQRPVYPPQQKPVYPGQQRPVYPPQQKPVYPPQQKPVYPPQQKPVYPLQQKPVYPGQQAASYQPQAQSVHPETKWKSVKMRRMLSEAAQSMEV